VKRAALVVLALAVIAAVVVVARDRRDADTGRVDVVFDTAKGMVPGQLVKIAGARAGRVDAVDLTPGNRARMRLRVERRYLPFRADASCRILPEGPISENYVECDPGQDTARELPSRDGAPTVPVRQTVAPVSIQDLLNVFAAPANSRLRLLLNELGIATAGRGGDLDDILRRSNPALTRTAELLRVIDGQRSALRRAISQTDTVLDGLATDERAVGRFVRNAASTTTATAAKRRSLGQTIERLPALLREARGGLRSVDRATAAGTPLLRDLRASAPVLQRVTSSLPAFAREGTPAVRQVAAAAREGRRAVGPTRKVARSANALGDITPVIRDLKTLMVSLRDKGGFEKVLGLAYSLANLGSLYDGVSHMVTLIVGVQAQCLVPTPEPVPGCDSTYKAGGTLLNDPANKAETRRILRNALAKLTPKQGDDKRKPAASKPAVRRPEIPKLPDLLPKPSTRPARPADILQKLLPGAGSQQQGQPQGGAIGELLDFLLRP
jgi:virulence factor Mce-like protein